ncbi:MAG: hypothetical protein QME35_09665 [Thermoanaerobacteraceae bacterium]|nr:hypothetical protein [Thermoanaerobacteraceae bacterium]
MKKFKFYLMFLLVALMINTSFVQVFANNTNDVKVLEYSVKEKAKKEASVNLIKQGIVEKINKEISKYNAEYKSKILTDSEIQKMAILKTTKNEDVKYLSVNSVKPLLSSLSLDLGDKNPQGTNNISFDNFDTGDIILVHDGFCPYGYYRHAGIFDSSRYRGLDSRCFISTEWTPGVVLETPKLYRNYDEAVGLWIPLVSYTKKINIISYLSQQLGKPYNILSSKSNRNEWYCSKLPWAGYYDKGLDIDGDGGYWVKPVDIYNSNKTSPFAYGY